MICPMAKFFRSLVICLALILLLAPALATTINVGPGKEFSKIQDAIDAASSGDVIEIHAGDYFESINITKKLAVCGAPGEEKPVLHAYAKSSPVSILADAVNLSGLNLTGATGWSMSGIKVLSQNNIIANNTIHNNSLGIYAAFGNNTIDANEVFDNFLGGIVLFSAMKNKVSNNDVYENNQAGIMLIESDYNIIAGNRARENMGIGLKLFRSKNNSVSKNELVTNDYGIVLSEAEDNLIESNTAINNDYGIYPYLSTGNAISNNTAFENDYAIYLWDCRANRVTGNNLEDNDGTGITLFYSDDNVFENNDANRNLQFGIHLISSSRYLIQGNNASIISGGTGLFLEDSGGNSLFENQAVMNFDKGISLLNSSGNILEGNIVRVCPVGILVSLNCSENLISKNLVSGDNTGILVEGAHNNSIKNNTISRIATHGIYINSSERCNIQENDVFGCQDALMQKNSTESRFIGNQLHDNSRGIIILASTNCLAMGNIILRNKEGLYMEKSGASRIDSNQLLENNNGVVIRESAGINLSENMAESTEASFSLSSVAGCIITGNAISRSRLGIKMVNCSHNLLIFNNLSKNQDGLSLDEGVYPEESSNNEIYLNSFLENVYNVYSFISTNSWSSAKPLRYQYHGRTFQNNLGNFWNDDRLKDSNSDGIGDTSIVIGSNEDNSPLMEEPLQYKLL
ncbi:Cell surface glycoprotein [uncultured archaeon]|nr:Cell surface glycoprotein [uncultured archaeon]